MLHQNTDPKIRCLSKYFKTISREKLQLFFFFLRLTVTTLTQLINKNLELVFLNIAGKLYFSDSHSEVIHKMLNVKKKKKARQKISYKAGKMKSSMASRPFEEKETFKDRITIFDMAHSSKVVDISLLPSDKCGGLLWNKVQQSLLYQK